MSYQTKTKGELINELQELQQKYNSLKVSYDKDMIKQGLAEKALRLSEEKYRLLAELSPEMIYLIDQKGYVSYVNSIAAAPLHSDSEKLIGRHLTEIFSPDIANAHLAVIKEVFETKQKIQKEIEEAFPIGKIWIEVRLSPLISGNGDVIGVLGISNDITLRKRVEEALKKSEIRFKTMFSDAPLGIALVDSITGKIYDVNPMFAKIAGRTIAEMADIDLISITHPDDIQSDLDNMALLVKGEINDFQMEKRYIRPDGSIVWINMTTSHLINEENMPLRYLCMIEDITERKRVVEELKESSRYSRNLIEASLDPLVTINNLGKITDVNRSAEKVTGVPRGQLIGSDFSGYFTDPLKAREGYNQVYKLGFVTDYPLSIKHHNGQITDVLYNASLYQNEDGTTAGVFAAARDITDRKRIEESLIKSENSARALLDAMPDLMFKINSEGVFLDYKSEKENFVYQTESIIGLKIRDIMPPDFADLVEQKMRQVFQTGEMQLYEYNLLLPTKGIREFEARMVNCSFDEVVIVVRDITERKKTELEIVHKNEELRKINAEKDKFFSILAHDLRSPFNGFLGLTEIIAKELHQMTLDEIQQIALLMNNSATNLYTLLGNLLEWSRLQRGLIAVSPEPFVLLPRISNSLKLIVESAKNKVIQLDFNIPNDLTVFTDANMLEGIIRNLANNSVKFTPKGGRIVVSAKTEANSKIRISVKDTGIGMSKEMINNLFRLDVNTRRRGTEGEPNSGLGLIICQDLIEKLGGELLIESEQGKGTEFYFTIPG